MVQRKDKHKGTVRKFWKKKVTDDSITIKIYFYNKQFYISIFYTNELIKYDKESETAKSI